MRLYTIESVISENKWKVLLFVVLITTAIIAADGYIFPGTTLGILYVIPVTVAALVVSRWQIIVLAVIYAILREHFGPNPWSSETTTRLGMGLLAFVATGLLVLESTRSRRIHAESLEKVQAESAPRRKAEEDARAVIESSPAAILAVGPDGMIEMRNAAGTRLR